MVTGTRAYPIPEDLGVHVGVAIDEARCHHMAFGVDGLGTLFANAADHRNLAVRDAHIGVDGRCTGAVNDGTVLDHQIVLHRFPCESVP